METVIIKSLNNRNEKAKTYITDFENAIIFRKITLVKDLNFKPIMGGVDILKKTKNYIITLHWFSIKKETLYNGLTALSILEP